jgi:hypothetical protein
MTREEGIDCFRGKEIRNDGRGEKKEDKETKTLEKERKWKKRLCRGRACPCPPG